MDERWTEPGWLAEAHAWIEEQLARAGEQVTGPIEQPHVRSWSTVLRVPAASGDVWFKANEPQLAYEAGIVDVLARRRPDAVPPLLGVDLESGWMLMADAGTRVRELVEADGDLSHWLEIMPLYAGLQLDLMDDVDALLARGLRRCAPRSDGRTRSPRSWPRSGSSIRSSTTTSTTAGSSGATGATCSWTGATRASRIPSSPSRSRSRACSPWGSTTSRPPSARSCSGTPISSRSGARMYRSGFPSG